MVVWTSRYLLKSESIHHIYSYTMATHLLACCLLQVHELPAPCAAFVGSTAISGSGDRSINLRLGNWLHQSKVVSHQWLFQVPLKSGLGSIVHPPIGRYVIPLIYIYTTYSPCRTWGLYATDPTLYRNLKNPLKSSVVNLL